MFGFKADALKAGAEMGDQVLNIVRIQAQLKLTMRPMHVPLAVERLHPTQTSQTPLCRQNHAHR